MAKSNYTYKVESLDGNQVIVIEDQNLGRMSVTNNIEEVIKEIEYKESLDATECLVVYKDCDEVWDGYDYAKRDFLYLGKQHWKHAVQKYLNEKAVTY